MVKNINLQNKAPKSSKAQRGVAFSKSNASTNPHRKLPDGMKAGFFRSKSTINRINMYRGKPDEAARREEPNKPMRIEPDRRWFGNTRVIQQDKLEKLRSELSKSEDDPYSVLLKRSKLPLSLLTENDTPNKIKLLEVESFADTFGSKKTRKRPRLDAEDLESLATKALENSNDYQESEDTNIAKYDEFGNKNMTTEKVLDAGTSKRIWGELYKVVDSSDIIVFCLDARDPIGTRTKWLEDKLKKEKPHKHQIILLNKIDLIPIWVTKKWLSILSQERPTIAFHASITNAYGKATFINLLRQLASLHKDKKHLSVGFIGYPNVGKSSIINAIKGKKVCESAPIPGETKVWKYITLTNKIYLIDCPGVVDVTIDDTSKVIRGTIRMEKIEFPSSYVEEILRLVKREYVNKYFKLEESDKWTGVYDLLELVARKKGKLLKGGEPDIEIVSRSFIFDFQRGKIPFFVSPSVYLASLGITVTKESAENKEGEIKEEEINALCDVEGQFKELDNIKCTHQFQQQDLQE